MGSLGRLIRSLLVRGSIDFLSLSTADLDVVWSTSNKRAQTTMTKQHSLSFSLQRKISFQRVSYVRHISDDGDDAGVVLMARGSRSCLLTVMQQLWFIPKLSRCS
jgi:hypothetical protein